MHNLLHIAPARYHYRTRQQHSPLRRVPLAVLLDAYHGDPTTRRKIQRGLLDHLACDAPIPKILDLATGNGIDAFYLASHGHSLVGNEIDKHHRLQLQNRIAQGDVSIELRSVDWRRLYSSRTYRNNEFGLIFALGNSFPTYLSNPSELPHALRGIARILSPGGLLLFDSRNYDYLLDRWRSIAIDPIAEYAYLGRSTYLNIAEVTAFPYHVEGFHGHFMWLATTSGLYATCRLLLLRRASIIRYLRKAGFLIERLLFDYGTSTERSYDFVQFVARKRS